MPRPTVSEFTAEARGWLDSNAKRRHDSSADASDDWGVAEFSVAVFHALSFEQEQGLLNEITGWHRKKAERGYHSITGSPEYDGLLSWFPWTGPVWRSDPSSR